MKKICCISDLHGVLVEVPDCDIVVIAGDVCPSYNHSIRFQQRWLEEDFNPWLEMLPCDKVVGIAGNNDWIFEKEPDKVPELDWIYLKDSKAIVEGIRFYGTPWTPFFCDWAFNLRAPCDEACKYSIIPEDTEVLITHGPPYGILDKVEGEHKHLGSKPLKKKINTLKNLKLSVFGHIHSAHGKDVKKDTIFINASVLDEQYENSYKPIIVEIEEDASGRGEDNE